MLGRVIDGTGTPIDGKGPINGETYAMPIERKAPGVIYRQPVDEPLQTGLKAVDANDSYWERPERVNHWR